MKKVLLCAAAVFAAIAFLLPSCKKVSHSTNPTPDNYRLWSYSKVTTKTIIAPPTITPVTTDNYRFEYDGNNRVSIIYFTSNDSNKLKIGLGNLSIKFTYVSPDTIYKTSTDVNTSNVMERDTFIQNSQGQIVDAYFPNEVHHFLYYGKLLANETVIYRDTSTAVSAHLTYTSNNGDFLNRNFDGNLTVTFPDSGIRASYIPGDPYRDTTLTFPVDVTWTIFSPDGSVVPVTHPGVTYTDALSGYFSNYITVDAVDVNGVRPRTGYFPAGYPATQFYQIYDQLANRTGDYLQLNSFTIYGVNIYQNVHLLYKISSVYNTTTVDYTIDADSKITNSNVVIKDSVLKNTVNEAYKLQYETF